MSIDFLKPIYISCSSINPRNISETYIIYIYNYIILYIYIIISYHIIYISILMYIYILYIHIYLYIYMYILSPKNIHMTMVTRLNFYLRCYGPTGRLIAWSSWVAAQRRPRGLASTSPSPRAMPRLWRRRRTCGL